MIGFLKKEGGQKDEQVTYLQSELGQLKDETASETKTIANKFKSTVDDLEEQLQDKTEEVS